MEFTESDQTEFFKDWFHQLQDICGEMKSVRSSGTRDEAKIKAQIDKTVKHYDMFYRARFDMCRSDPVFGFITPWATSIERCVVFWLGGWRPNIIVHLLYSESSHHFERQLQDVLHGAGSGDIGDLSPIQLTTIDSLQRRTIQEEDAIDEKINQLHGEMVNRFNESKFGISDVTSRIKEMISWADDLRVRTLHSAIGILRPIQALDLLIAVADFEIGLRKYGQKQDGLDD
ncbi:hypothetical protein LUZ60_012300 [Juncus effusus]|nr:hypothetical protein LUZ60_012300 [Juncus effusus]